MFWTLVLEKVFLVLMGFFDMVVIKHLLFRMTVHWVQSLESCPGANEMCVFEQSSILRSLHEFGWMRADLKIRQCSFGSGTTRLEGRLMRNEVVCMVWVSCQGKSMNWVKARCLLLYFQFLECSAKQDIWALCTGWTIHKRGDVNNHLSIPKTWLKIPSI